jgi:4,5:9,10-diseco-3-hydroxy-5,9,17-trioxoandrosta-1(10),2-diene-4-oate hydrolase
MVIHDPALVTDEDVKYDYELARQPGAQQAFLRTLRSLANIFGQKPSLYGPILQMLPSITQPVLVLWGREDTIVPLKHSEAYRQILKARLHIFERCGHIPQFEHPEEFDKELLGFLGQS